MGARYTVPNDAAFTWIQLNQNVQNLGLTDTVNRASHVNATDGDLYGTQWGGWLSSYISRHTPSVPSLAPYATADWVRQNFLSGFRLGSVENAQVWRAYGYNDQPPYVITGVINSNTDDLIDNVTRRPLQMYINGWRNIDWL
ncbi:phage tail fiber repeat-containing protein [Salmonella enterica]|uniref:Phage tail fiber repeat-containing protein n=1 Tax=Salmonella sp. NCTC 6947 TaxID=2583581 RepID=A0A509BPR5_9ENTR|nr:phage tail fiber repeat-containing protein [Salmonella enterica]VUC75282.1 phage tail fiber repeat-containing protein [Salmonella enterica]